MPKPPLLDTLDWNAVYDSGVDFDTWLTQGENDEHIVMMKDIHQNQILDDSTLEQIASIKKRASIVAIAEDWCPDVIRHAPILQKICDHSEHLSVRYLTRESHKEVFVRFLTNGGEAIPKFIFLSDAWVECGNWGPMTQTFRDLISRGKAFGDVMAARKIIHEAYLSETVRADVVEELMHHILIATAESV
jgi:hypothetical protein